jgi:hypothetical protein
MKTAQAVAQEMLDTYGWFVVCSNTERSPGYVIYEPIYVYGGQSLSGPAVILGEASLEDLQMQDQLQYGRARGEIPLGTRIYRCTAE